MARKKESSLETSEKVFPTRLRELMEERRINQQQLADSIGVRRQTISNYTNGQSSPDWETLVKIAQLFHVSSDYLLGLSNAATDDRDEKFVCEYTGLSKEAIEKFHKYAHLRNHETGILKVFDSLIVFFYEQLLHRLYLIKENVADGEEWLKDMKDPRDTWKDVEYSRTLNGIFEILRQSLFSYYELCRKIPNKLFDSDRVYDELEKRAWSTDPESETDLEDFLKNGLE